MYTFFLSFYFSLSWLFSYLLFPLFLSFLPPSFLPSSLISFFHSFFFPCLFFYLTFFYINPSLSVLIHVFLSKCLSFFSFYYFTILLFYYFYILSSTMWNWFSSLYLPNCCIFRPAFGCCTLQTPMLDLKQWAVLYLSIWIDSKSIVWDSSCNIHW